jgi:ketosteroid isomerase-like protein
MKRTLAVWLACLSTAALVGAQDLQQELTKVENGWAEAIVKRDVGALQKLYADEYIATDPMGSVYTKAQDLASLQSGEFTLTSYKLDDVKVQSHGTIAVVTGRNTIKATYKGKPIDGAYRFTDVFVKRDGRWQAAATQATLIAPPQ